MTLTETVTGAARRAGASAVGVAGAGRFDEALATLRANAARGLSGPLGFTYDDPETATDVRESIPWARSMVVFGVSYSAQAPPPADTGPIVGRFATEDHYRSVRLVADAVSECLRAEGARAVALIDDNRLVDRSAAIRAGIGWLGRSTMVLSPGHGPWMLLGSVVSDAELDRSRPMRRHCGTCTACLPACPTGALGDGALDARRCLSTWLQAPGSIPQWIRPLLGRRIYGCDDCLTACPPGRPALRAAPAPAQPRSFADMLARDNETLLNDHRWWYVPRRDGRFIRRNLLVAAGNSGDASVIPALAGHLRHPSSMIRGHAAWALARALGGDASAPIAEAVGNERAPEAREEMLLALLQTERPRLHARILELDEDVSTDPEKTALGLVGGNLSSGDVTSREIQPLILIDGSPIEAPDDLLADVVRVNDRGRVLERARRGAVARLKEIG